MWKIPFDTIMLDGDVIISCPSKELVPELLESLGEHGVQWGAGVRACSESAHLWDVHKENTCYRVHNKRMGYGDKDFYESEEGFIGYIKCTFYGNTEDFETASDDELAAFLGI